jgi:hypothetical protein
MSIVNQVNIMQKWIQTCITRCLRALQDMDLVAEENKDAIKLATVWI